MYNVFRKLVLLFFFINSLSGTAQDVQFSQVFADRLYLNPAFAGIDYCPRISLSYRNQWPGTGHPFTTYSFSFDKFSESFNGGLGVRIMKDVQSGGIFSQFSADLIYAYHAKISRKTWFNLAFELSIYQKEQNTQNLVFSSMIDPALGIIFPNMESFHHEKFVSPDFSAGILVGYTNYFFGISATHIPQNIVDEHNLYLPFKFSAHIGGIFKWDKLDKKRPGIVFEPNLIFIKQQDVNLLYYGTYFDIHQMSFGLFYRQNLKLRYDAMVVSCHLHLSDLVIGYSYDITLSKFFGQTLGAHEISLSYILSCDRKIRKYKTISCPTF
jgi:type IX secretion system PorP/SprF family membrane protein